MGARIVGGSLGVGALVWAWVASADGPATLAARIHPRPRPFALASDLPVPEPPAAPPQPTEFAVSANDPAGAAARAIAKRVASFRAYREEIPGATWRTANAARFRIRPDAACRGQLQHLDLPVTALDRPLATPVPSPVTLHGAVASVNFFSLHADREIELACELAARLDGIARVLKRHGVRAVSVASSYRGEPRTSFHTFGLALDISAFRTDKGTLVVHKHFELSPNTPTCEATPRTDEGRRLLAIACDLAASNLLSSVLTPNYNTGHRDHFHLDVRPDDPRVFLR